MRIFASASVCAGASSWGRAPFPAPFDWWIVTVIAEFREMIPGRSRVPCPTRAGKTPRIDRAMVCCGITLRTSFRTKLVTTTFAVHFGTFRLGAWPNQYGTQVPDWLDEAVAVWMESAVMRRKRVGAIRSSTPSLERVVTLEHPNTDLVSRSAAEFRISTRTVVPPCAKCTWLSDSLRPEVAGDRFGYGYQRSLEDVIWYADTPPAKCPRSRKREFYPPCLLIAPFHSHSRRTRRGCANLSRYPRNQTQKPRIEVLSHSPDFRRRHPLSKKRGTPFATMPQRTNRPRACASRASRASRLELDMLPPPATPTINTPNRPDYLPRAITIVSTPSARSADNQR